MTTVFARTGGWAGRLVWRSIIGPYSRQPSSASTLGTNARKTVEKLVAAAFGDVDGGEDAEHGRGLGARDLGIRVWESRNAP